MSHVKTSHKEFFAGNYHFPSLPAELLNTTHALCNNNTNRSDTTFTNPGRVLLVQSSSKEKQYGKSFKCGGWVKVWLTVLLVPAGPITMLWFDHKAEQSGAGRRAVTATQTIAWKSVKVWWTNLPNVSGKDGVELKNEARVAFWEMSDINAMNITTDDHSWEQRVQLLF